TNIYIYIYTGESLHLSCQASGFIFRLEWMSWIHNNERQMHYSDKVRKCFILYRDNLKDQMYLQMNHLKPEDTAIYYCTGGTIRGSESEAKQKLLISLKSSENVFPIKIQSRLILTQSDAKGPKRTHLDLHFQSSSPAVQISSALCSSTASVISTMDR
uniref:Ig-like domain-containing protein n=1 Tax=Laticauda laticaudata TaxID=8630 RepID=A0A8C5RUT6_LATLA